MMELSQVLDLIASFGWGIVFLYLFVNEQKSHETTRRLYRNDLRSIANLHPDSDEELTLNFTSEK